MIGRPLFIAGSRLGGVAERSNAAVLKMTLAVALACNEWHSFRNSGTWMHGGEPAGTGVGIKVGIKHLTRTTRRP